MWRYCQGTTCLAHPASHLHFVQMFLGVVCLAKFCSPTFYLLYFFRLHNLAKQTKRPGGSDSSPKYYTSEIQMNPRVPGLGIMSGSRLRLWENLLPTLYWYIYCHASLCGWPHTYDLPYGGGYKIWSYAAAHPKTTYIKNK